MRIALFFAAAAALIPLPAQAAWLRASSDHFVVYADDSESKLRTFADQLERYHSAMAYVTGRNVDPPSPSNRVTVFVVSSESEVRRLHGGNSRYVGGFYIPRAGGSVAIVPRVSTQGARTGDLEFSMVVLLHEYAHHFLISTSSFPLPRWVSEGAAEFFASARFASDGSVEIGRPAQHRAGELFYAPDVTAKDLLDPEAYEKRNRGKTYDAFYGKSWLLYHYLFFEPTRAGQFDQYVRALIAGKKPREAAEVFGDPKVLEADLDRYLLRKRILMLALKPERLHVGAISVTRLSAGEAAMMPVRIRSQRGVNGDEAKALLPEARAIAARYPQDAAVLAALAEAEYDAGYDAECIAAADKAIAIDPRQTRAYVQKGFALFRQTQDAGGDLAAYTKARAPFVALNRVENDHPLPLIYYYSSFTLADAKPSTLAVRGLERAVHLAPFDPGLRMTLVMQQLRDGQSEDARANLVPIAYNPHGGKLAEYAQQAMARIDANPKWDGADMDKAPDEEEGE